MPETSVELADLVDAILFDAIFPFSLRMGLSYTYWLSVCLLSKYPFNCKIGAKAI